MFYDEATVSLRAGNGGHGCLSFRREKFVPFGGPDGGDGGKGGDVILVGDENTGDLRAYHFKPGWNAKGGQGGAGRQKTGHSGADCKLLVPLGTVVYEAQTGRQVTEITRHEQEVTILKGGQGGLGNVHFKSSVNQAPRRTTPGLPGEAGQYKFVLKMIADIGLVGFPNAGKSSLIGLLTNAEPKVAHYPFTTLEPSVGVIDFGEKYTRLKLADIPGLIEGASENRGLGHRFLRHIERCSLLLFIVDAAGEDGRDPVGDFRALLTELGNYSEALLEKPRLIAANKMDEPTAMENLPRLRKALKEEVLSISCLSEEGLLELKQHLLERVEALREAQA